MDRADSGESRTNVAALSPAERMDLSRALGERCLDLYMAAHPDKSLAEAREILQRSNRYGRMPSAVADGPER
jgi:hypothetical protein